MVGFADALEYRDSALAYDPDYTSASISPYHYAERANDMGTACLGVTGWMDGGGYSTGAIQRYTWQKNPAKRLLIGPWDHGARAHVSPWRRAEALRFALLGEYLRFFDTHLKGLDTGLPEEKPVHYYTMGAEAWQAAATWPPGATATMELFFDEAAKLNPEPPRHGEGVDHHLADFACGSGRQTRYERLYLVVVEEYYPDWTGRDEKMLTFTGPVLEADTEVTGQPVATLHLESSEPDCALFVYLEDLAPDGTCRYVTEGVFRALHRRSGRPPATIPPTGPQHSYLGHDAAPLVPGEVATVAFELLATSYLFRKGHRIRVAIAAADADHFRAISEDRPPRLTVHRGPAHPSRLTLPVVRRGVD
jgi:hypothetical protein